MIIVAIIICVIAIGVCWFTLWAIGKLNKYIARLEKQISEQLDKTDELEDLLIQSNIKNKKIVRKNLIPDDQD